MQPHNTCNCCLFFEPNRQVSECGRKYHVDGQCKRYAPRPLSNADAMNNIAIWPTVIKGQWCGDYMPRDVPRGTEIIGPGRRYTQQGDPA